MADFKQGDLLVEGELDLDGDLYFEIGVGWEYLDRDQVTRLRDHLNVVLAEHDALAQQAHADKDP